MITLGMIIIVYCHSYIWSHFNVSILILESSKLVSLEQGSDLHLFKQFSVLTANTRAMDVTIIC